MKKRLFLSVLVAYFWTLPLWPGGLQNLEWSGKFRIRALHYGSSSKVPGYLTGKGYKELSYQDLFFRNSFVYSPQSSIQLESVFDTYAVFGENDAELGNSDLGFQIRNAILKWRKKYFLLEMGFLPYSLPGGFILASNGAGVKLTLFFREDKLQPFFYWIKAYDNSRYDFGDGIGQNNYVDNDILVAGLKLSGFESVPLQIYHVYQHDKDNLHGAISPLHWTGINAQFLLSKLYIQLDSIYNFGQIRSGGKSTQINAALASLTFALQFNRWNLKAFAKSASGDLNNSTRDDHFQTINASHYITNVGLDNSGGIAVHSGSLSGLFAGGGGVSYAFRRITMEALYGHYRILDGFTNYAHEVDANVKYLLADSMVFDFQSGVFFPSRGFSSFTNQSTGAEKPVYEFIAAISYRY